MTAPGANGAAAPIPRWRPEADARRRVATRPAAPSIGLHTRLSHAGRAGTQVHGFVNPPLHRGSTVLYRAWRSAAAAGAHRFDQKLIYGVMGTPPTSRWKT